MPLIKVLTSQELRPSDLLYFVPYLVIPSLYTNASVACQFTALPSSKALWHLLRKIRVSRLEISQSRSTLPTTFLQLPIRGQTPETLLSLSCSGRLATSSARAPPAVAMSPLDSIFDYSSFQILPMDEAATSHHHGDGRRSHRDDCVPQHPPSQATHDSQPQFLTPHATHHNMPFASHDDGCLYSNSCFVTGSVDTNQPSHVDSMQILRGLVSEEPPSLTRDYPYRYRTGGVEQQSGIGELSNSGCSQDGVTCEEDCKEPCEGPCVIDELCGECRTPVCGTNLDPRLWCSNDIIPRHDKCSYLLHRPKYFLYRGELFETPDRS